MQIDLLTRRLSDNSDRLMSTTEKAMVRLFSPSLTFTDVSESVNNDTASYIAAKKKKWILGGSYCLLRNRLSIISMCFCLSASTQRRRLILRQN